jgi:protein-tyrosine-phosphatase
MTTRTHNRTTPNSANARNVAGRRTDTTPDPRPLRSSTATFAPRRRTCTDHPHAQEAQMTVNVLFLCPHAAGKSILAATYFSAAAARIGLDATAHVAGPEPDSELDPRVRRALQDQGFLEQWTPRLVQQHEADAADTIINIGCDRDSIPTTKAVTDWDVPLLTDDFSASIAALHQLAESLARSLSE